LNAELKQEGYTGGNLVWYNDETGNPFSPGFNIEDSPIFISPEGAVVQARSKDELIVLYRKLELTGFAPEYSPIFGF
jgi:insecticidal toxin complex protein TccC